MDDVRVFEAIGSLRGPGCAARLLRGATLTLFQASDDPARDRHWLCAPLSRAVASHKSRQGQAICAELGEALAAGDDAGALDACRRLIQLEVSITLGAPDGRQEAVQPLCATSCSQGLPECVRPRAA
ncbi:MAG: hypothetical protein AB7F98_16785 [Novosphingobium sp.]